MAYLTELFTSVASRVSSPVCVVLGAPRPVTHLLAALGDIDVTCFQFDLHQGSKLRESLAEAGQKAEVVVQSDLWDLPKKFQTVVFPAAAQSDRELKLDMIEQGYHILATGGYFITLSEYEKDSLFAKAQKKVFGRCGESPSQKHGMAFWSQKTTSASDPSARPRRRHQITYHARLGDGPSLTFVSRPGTFSYGRFDNGSRALLEVAELHPGDHLLDLGCGNGVVGCLAAARIGDNGRVTFVDSNLRSLALAELNAKNNAISNATFVAATRLEGLQPRSFDVILANPPYYAKSEITRLFVEGAKELLRPGGRYAIVTKLPSEVVPLIFETFGECDTIENRGYTIIRARA